MKFVTDNLISGLSFVPTVIAALHPSNSSFILLLAGLSTKSFLTSSTKFYMLVA